MTRRPSSGLLLGLLLAWSGSASAVQAQPPTPPASTPQAPQPPPQPPAEAEATGEAEVRGRDRRQRLADRAGARECAGHGHADRQPHDRELPGHQLRRPAAGRPRPQRHADLGPRHQHHLPRRDRHARHVAARAGRRPQHLPGLLRLRGVGLPADRPAGDQADRGHPRPGVGGVGRQRAHRRGQHHHQDTARIAGLDIHSERRPVRPRRHGRGTRQRRAVLRVGQPRRRRERPLGVQGLDRVLPAGRDGAAVRADSERERRAVSRLPQQRHATAQVRRAPRLRPSRWPAEGRHAGRILRNRGDDPLGHRPLRHRPRDATSPTARSTTRAARRG